MNLRCKPWLQGKAWSGLHRMSMRSRGISAASIDDASAIALLPFSLSGYSMYQSHFLYTQYYKLPRVLELATCFEPRQHQFCGLADWIDNADDAWRAGHCGQCIRCIHLSKLGLWHVLALHQGLGPFPYSGVTATGEARE